MRKSSNTTPPHIQWFLLAAMAAANTVAGADDVADDSGGLELPQVTVSAEKRETNLQSTPISISVLDDEALVDRHAQSLADLNDGSIPSLRVAPFFARSSALTIGIRGVGANSDANQPSRDQGTGVYVDGVYLGRSQGLGAALYDVERIEVLKGPQGTLFGRNTQGGAVSIITRKPTGELHLRSALGVSTFSGSNAAIHLDLPSLNGVALKISGVMTRRDGTVENPMHGQPGFNSYDRRGLRTEALWKTSDTFTAHYAFDFSHDATTPHYVQALEAGLLPRSALTPLQADRADTATVGTLMEPSVGRTRGHMLTLDWHPTENLQIKSISSYRSLDQSQFDNGAVNLSVFAPNQPFARYSIAHIWQDQYSQELQLIGDTERVHYVGGAFYYHEDVRDTAQTPNTLQWNETGTDYSVITLPPLSQIRIDRASSARTRSIGLFGQATWTPPLLDERLQIAAGGRWSRDEKTGSLTTVNGAPPVVCAPNGDCVTGAVPLDAAWSRFDPMINVSFHLAPAVHIYGKWSTGYRAGGANSRSLTYRPFEPESVSSFELGAKSEFLNRRARFNVALFSSRLKDMQIDFNADLVPPNTRTTLETTNAQGKGTSRGIEADLMLMPLRDLRITLGYAFTDVSLPKAPNPFAAGNPLVTVYPLYTPENAGTAAIDYQFSIGGVALRAHLDGNWSEGYYTNPADPTLSDDSFIVNGRLSLADISLGDHDAQLELSVWSRNLLNESHAFLKNQNPALGTYALFNEPRSAGIEARLTF